ncbi:MAG TPA: hypothetical protein VN749_05600 [Candidatus Eisenbacteria bacterium]|nr:hypothetical protein [Candidatus Eisenbacteria bacterium]
MRIAGGRIDGSIEDSFLSRLQTLRRIKGVGHGWGTSIEIQLLDSHAKGQRLRRIVFDEKLESKGCLVKEDSATQPELANTEGEIFVASEREGLAVRKMRKKRAGVAFEV